MSNSQVGEKLWAPSAERQASSRMFEFMEMVRREYEPALSSYPALYQWSVERPERFWPALWAFCGVQHSRGWDRVMADAPRILRLSEPLQRRAWDRLVADVERPMRTAALARQLDVSREHLSRQFGAGGAPNLNRVIDLTTWFASYAPYEKPRYVVLVMIESGKSGGETCAPVAKKIYEAIQYEERHRAPALAQSTP